MLTLFGSRSIFDNYNKDILYDDTVVQEKLIPVTYSELIETSLSYLELPVHNQQFRLLSNALYGYYNKSFNQNLSDIHALYQPLDPDNELLTLKNYTQEDYRKLQEDIFSEVDYLMEKSNYIKLELENIQEILNRDSQYVEVSVDFDDFEKISIYYRGNSIQKELKRNIWTLFMTTKEFEYLIYNRLFILLQPKSLEKRAKEVAEEKNIDIKKAKRKLKRRNPLLTSRETTNVYMKIFKNIPHDELRMLFPNVRVKLKSLDKIKIGVLGGGSIVAGTSSFLVKISNLMDPISMILALGAYGAILWRQIKGIIFHRTQYLAKLAKKLYTNSLGNNECALNHIIKAAIESESKEAWLTYIFLYAMPNITTSEELDQEIEKFFHEIYGIRIDFEISDGLNKLIALKIIDNPESLSILTIEETIKKYRDIF